MLPAEVAPEDAGEVPFVEEGPEEEAEVVGTTGHALAQKEILGENPKALHTAIRASLRKSFFTSAEQIVVSLLCSARRRVLAVFVRRHSHAQSPSIRLCLQILRRKENLRFLTICQMPQRLLHLRLMTRYSGGFVTNSDHMGDFAQGCRISEHRIWKRLCSQPTGGRMGSHCFLIVLF